MKNKCPRCNNESLEHDSANPEIVWCNVCQYGLECYSSHTKPTLQIPKHTRFSIKPYTVISPAALQIAKANLAKFKEESEEAFLVRAEMDRKLDIL